MFKSRRSIGGEEQLEEVRTRLLALVSEEKNKFALSVLRRVRVKLEGREPDSLRKVSGKCCLEISDSGVLVECGGAGGLHHQRSHEHREPDV